MCSLSLSLLPKIEWATMSFPVNELFCIEWHVNACMNTLLCMVLNANICNKLKLELLLYVKAGAFPEAWADAEQREIREILCRSKIFDNLNLIWRCFMQFSANQIVIYSRRRYAYMYKFQLWNIYFSLMNAHTTTHIQTHVQFGNCMSKCVYKFTANSLSTLVEVGPIISWMKEVLSVQRKCLG